VSASCDPSRLDPYVGVAREHGARDVPGDAHDRLVARAKLRGDWIRGKFRAKTYFTHPICVRLAVVQDDHRITPLDESSSRQIWVGWGSGVVCLGLAYLVGGLFFPYALVFLGGAMALRGHLPGLFAKHVDSQPIAGIPYRREESIKSWAIALPVCLILARGSSSIHRRIAPAHPDLAATILDGIKKLLPPPNVAPTPSLIPTPETPDGEPTPGPQPPLPIPHARNLDVLALNSIKNITIGNPSEMPVYVLDLFVELPHQATTPHQTLTFPLEFEIGAKGFHTYLFPNNDPSQLFHSTERFGDTFEAHSEVVTKRYGQNCLIAVIFSKSDDGFIQMDKFYSAHGQILGGFDVDGVLHYRFSGHKQSSSQKIASVAMLMWRDSCQNVDKK
jgi:hypothetical protein